MSVNYNKDGSGGESNFDFNRILHQTKPGSLSPIKNSIISSQNLNEVG